MLSLLKQKISKEYIYIKKHPSQLISLEEGLSKNKNAKDKVSETALYFSEMIDYNRLKYIIKLINNMDGKYIMNISQVKEAVEFLLVKAIENFISNPKDSSYISENIVLTVSSYGGKHYISICPRFDFGK